MNIVTRDPYTGKVLDTFKSDTQEEALEKIRQARRAQQEWKRSLDTRIDYFREVIKPNFERKTEEIASIMTEEMGKPITQSISEVKKSIKLLDYLMENARSIYSEEEIKTEASRSYVRFDPLGTIMCIEPWNFPVWQVARAAFPAMMAGNGVVLKHASIVTGVSLKLQEIVDSHIFRSLIVEGKTATSLIKHVEGVAFTGSTPVGSGIAAEAGKEMKRIVMELGGSDPFIILDSADLKSAAKAATIGRLQNNGQSCIASKRFLVHESVYDQFKELTQDEFSKIVIGDPRKKETYLGPLSSSEQKEFVEGQIKHLESRGRVAFIGEGEGNIVPPVLVELNENYQEEIFGPVAVLRKFASKEEAVRIANETPYGLGTSIWGEKTDAEKMVGEIEAGMVYINSIVFSDPRLPFGGVKKSGLGRELSKYGSREFTNMKTVWVN
ncbi:MAG: aldehyde dehydrogenase family protein [Thermoplasmatales archaeon]|nr:aldehyde dehydrogenase family protein [Candidatus Thermoplasmatota archaeon]MCL6003090.1 aldehyde dehydrogenase family protein [Candidatus Thermoplasmatota archaeon]MDA8054391.1 aldehyde dehydrogenase family protein [Thermoplasmatales archaeon]